MRRMVEESFMRWIIEKVIILSKILNYFLFSAIRY